MTEDDLEERVAEWLSRLRLTLAVAESCTGGLLGGAITSVPGSSAFFRGGVIAYSDDVKIDLLSVPASVISESGAVSAECARAMALGVRHVLHADFGVAVTGIAGPTGGTPGKPVGTTFIAVAGQQGVEVGCYRWSGDRQETRRQSVQAALKMLIAYVESLHRSAENGGTRVRGRPS